jgi:tetratricopeptide (TPR) repeat protein
VLSAHFLFWTLICYLRASTAEEFDRHQRNWMAGALGFYLLSLLSKAVGMTLPVVLLILDLYPLRRLSGNWRDWVSAKSRAIYWEKLPFFILATVFATVALYAQDYAEAMATWEHYPLSRRVAQAFYGSAFYIWKTLVPVGLSPFYQLYPRLNLFNPFDRPFVISGIAVAAITVGLLLLRKRCPAALASWACYIVIVSPVLGFAQSGPQLVADRYSYLSCLSWALLAGAGMLFALRGSASAADSHERICVTSGFAGLLLLVLGVLTWNQTYVWRNPETLWRQATAVSPRSSRAHVYLADYLKAQRRLEEAVKHYQTALGIEPDYVDIHYKISQALAGLGRFDQAIDHLRKYIQKAPPSAISHVDLGTFLGRQGKKDEEISEYQDALKIDPRSADAHFALGNALAMRGELEEARKHLRRAVELSPQTGEFYLSLGNVLVKQDLLAEATDNFRKAIEIKPDFLPARNNLGRLLAAQGDLPAAIETFREAVRIDPTFAPAHESLAQALAQIGKRDEAMEHYREAVRLMQLGAPAGAQP